MRISSMINAVDAHACGEPGRVITGGVLDVPGKTMFDKMCYLRDHADGLRKRMLREPRGYPRSALTALMLVSGERRFPRWVPALTVVRWRSGQVRMKGPASAPGTGSGRQPGEGCSLGARARRHPDKSRAR